MSQNILIKKEVNWREIDLDYVGENNYASFFSSKSNIHAYPAKAVPEMVSTLIENIKEEFNIQSVLDPFVGSGTTALESKHLNLNFYGSDLNPLAILISRTKCLTVPNSNYIFQTLRAFVEKLSSIYKRGSLIECTHFDNINYWFKEENIKELSFLKIQIDDFLKGKNKKYTENFYALILLTSFSSCIRTCSLTRNGEFKLYRMSPNEIEGFNISAIEIFEKNVNNLLDMLTKVNKVSNFNPRISIYLENAKSLKYMEQKKVDLVLTSPPYGDSKSTVAYGQFSRLSLQWISDLLNKYLGIKVYSDNCDEYLLGGKKSEIEADIDIILARSSTLQNLVNEMDYVINEDVKQLNKMKGELNDLQQQLEMGYIYKLRQINNKIFDLLRERVRLDFYREYNKETSLSRKEVKKLSSEKTDRFFEELFNGHFDNDSDILELLKEKLKHVMETIKRKILAVPKRKNEVLNFFKDLYQVVEASDRVLNRNGVQAWIVGHRTVLGKININMKDVLNDWFENIGYEKVTDLTREYSFKRLPHHINSTVNRNDQIKTMMQEYILIVKKP